MNLSIILSSLSLSPSLSSPSFLTAVINFMEVYNKSMCQSRETLVDIYSEYPEDTEYTYIPSCVVLKRCGGCCQDEALECVPVETRNVTLEVSEGPTTSPHPHPQTQPHHPSLVTHSTSSTTHTHTTSHTHPLDISTKKPRHSQAWRASAWTGSEGDS